MYFYPHPIIHSIISVYLSPTQPSPSSSLESNPPTPNFHTRTPSFMKSHTRFFSLFNFYLNYHLSLIQIQLIF